MIESTIEARNRSQIQRKGKNNIYAEQMKDQTSETFRSIELRLKRRNRNGENKAKMPK